MQEVAGKIRTVAANVDPSVGGAGINPTGHGEVGGMAMGVSAAGTHGLFQGQLQHLGNKVAFGLVFIGQVHIAGKARQTAGGCKVVVIHVVLLIY